MRRCLSYIACRCKGLGLSGRTDNVRDSGCTRLLSDCTGIYLYHWDENTRRQKCNNQEYCCVSFRNDRL